MNAILYSINILINSKLLEIYRQTIIKEALSFLFQTGITLIPITETLMMMKALLMLAVYRPGDREFQYHHRPDQE